MSSEDDVENEGAELVFAGARVVIVAESTELCENLIEVFSTRGASVKGFESGLKAIEYARANPTDVLIAADDLKYYDAVWISKEVKVSQSPYIPILWFLGKKSISRFDGRSEKSCGPMELVAPIHGALTKAREQNPQTVVEGGKKTVVLIDDEEGLRVLGQTILEMKGYEVITACDGKEGLQAVAAYPDVGCVLVDLKMPRMNGFEFLVELRNLTNGSDLPVIVVTSFTMKKTLEAGKKLNVSGWVIKPYEHDTLTAAVQKVFGEVA